MYILKKIRFDLGFGIRKFAREIGFSPAAIFSWENNLRTPNDESSYKIIDVLKSKWDLIVTMEELKPRK